MVKLANEGGETVSDLKAHITRLNDENAKLQKWVVALAVAALVSTFVQTAIAVLAYVNPPSPSASSDTIPVGTKATASMVPAPTQALRSASPSPLPPSSAPPPIAK